jgi:hypothetical protein
VNRRWTSPYRLRRIGLKQTTRPAEVARYCRYDLKREVARWAVLEGARSTLGMKNYSRLRRRLLGERAGADNEVYQP